MYYFVTKRGFHPRHYYAMLSEHKIRDRFSRNEIAGDWLVTANYLGESYVHFVREPATPATWMTVEEFLYPNEQGASVFDTSFRPSKADLKCDTSIVSFVGRIPRGLMWATWLATAVVLFFASLVLVGLASSLPTGGLYPIVFAIFFVIYWLLVLSCTWLGLVMQVKRWHDRNKSGWMVLINLIPVVGACWAFIELGFLPGSKWANRYGQDPSW